ncbi:MAG: hypothetical protein ACR2PL_07825 [Dehalococcoidia bacterium]
MRRPDFWQRQPEHPVALGDILANAYQLGPDEQGQERRQLSSEGDGSDRGRVPTGSNYSNFTAAPVTIADG